jgi:hypothetical protein
MSFQGGFEALVAQAGFYAWGFWMRTGKIDHSGLAKNYYPDK